MTASAAVDRVPRFYDENTSPFSSGANSFRESGRLIRPGGELLVCDDFIKDAGLKHARPASRWTTPSARSCARSGWLPIENNYRLMLYGGHAAQIGLKRGGLKHAFVVWRRNERPT